MNWHEFFNISWHQEGSEHVVTVGPFWVAALAVAITLAVVM